MNEWRECPSKMITQLVPMIVLASNWVKNRTIPDTTKPIPHPRGAYVQGEAGRGKLGAGGRMNSSGRGRQGANGAGSQGDNFRNNNYTQGQP